MYAVQAYPDLITDTSTSAEYELGSIRYQTPAENTAANASHFGPKLWVYVYNDEASTAFAEGTLVSIDTGDYAPFNGIVSAAAASVAGAILGVAGHAIAAGSYGWIVKDGICECLGDGSVAQGEAIVSHTSGQVDTMASGEEVGIIGIALEDDSTVGLKFTCKVSIP